MQDNNKEKNSTKKSKTKKSEVSKSSSNRGSAKKEVNNRMKELYENETQDIRAAFEAYFKRKY